MSEFPEVRDARPNPAPPDPAIVHRSRQALEAAINAEAPTPSRRSPRWLRLVPVAVGVAGFAAVLGVLLVKLGGADKPSAPATRSTPTAPVLGNLRVPLKVSLAGVAGARVGMTEAQVERQWGVSITTDAEIDGCRGDTLTARDLWVHTVFVKGRLASVWMRAGAETDAGLAIGAPEGTITEVYPSGLRFEPSADGTRRRYFTRRAQADAAGLRFDVDATDTVAAIAYGSGTLDNEFGCEPPLAPGGPDLSGTPGPAKVHVPLTTFTLDGVAGARIGMSQAEVEAAWDTKLQLSSSTGALGGCDVASASSGAARVGLEFREGKLSVISTSWPAGNVTTDAGIGIGSTKDELEAAYPAGLSSEVNKYDPSWRDYYYRRPSSPDAAGYRFQVSGEGKVVSFSYGNDGIAALEGCS